MKAAAETRLGSPEGNAEWNMIVYYTSNPFLVKMLSLNFCVCEIRSHIKNAVGEILN